MYLGQVVRLDWTHPETPGLEGSVLEAGFSPGATTISLPMGTATSFEAVVPSGVYYVRVRAVVNGVPAPPSNEVALSVGATAPPAPPGNLLSNVTGNQVRLAWQNAESGGLRTGVRIEAFTPTLTPLTSIDLGPDADTFATPAPAGYVPRACQVGGPGGRERRVEPGVDYRSGRLRRAGGTAPAHGHGQWQPGDHRVAAGRSGIGRAGRLRAGGGSLAGRAVRLAAPGGARLPRRGASRNVLRARARRVGVRPERADGRGGAGRAVARATPILPVRRRGRRAVSRTRPARTVARALPRRADT